ncbi:APC family permease [Rhodococcus opacus]|uniref:APC family permease n=1 Tax=Rhodococcus opacus TaxID=37919 RepID=UPI001C449CF7|nr:APC family permease [Rhodococcus opacus]MBV6762327.1 APC family permease [Rhodococcus opacus]
MDTTATHEASPPTERRLHGNLGVLGVSFMVIAGAAPLTVVGGPMALGLATGNGAGLPAAYLATLVVLLLFVTGFTAMTPQVRSAGAFYSYVHAGLGRIAGIGTGYAALLSYVSLYIGVYALFGTGLDALVVSFGGPSVPWWLWGAVGLCVISFLGYRNIELSGKILGVLLVAEVGIVLVLDARIVFGGGHEGMSTGFISPTTIFSGAPGVALLFAVLSFVGIEATAVFRDEARDPAKTIPRATFLSVTSVGIFYAVTCWALISAVGDSRIADTAAAGPETLLPSLSAQYLGRIGTDLTSTLFVTSIFAAGLTFHNVVSRYLFSLSSQDLLPRGLSVTHPLHGSPHRSSVTSTVAVIAGLSGAVLTGLDPMAELYTWTAGLASVGYVVLLVLTCLAVLVFFRRRSEKHSTARTVVAPALGLAGLLVILVMMLFNLDLLAGNNRVVSVAIVASLLVAYALGPIVGRLLPASGQRE